MIIPPTFQSLLTTFRNGLDGSLPVSFTDPLGKALAAAGLAVVKYSNALLKQNYAETAFDGTTTIGTTEINPLRAIGTRYGLPAPVIGSAQQVTATATVVNPTGNIISGTQLSSDVDNVVYTVDSTVPITGSTITLTLSATQRGQGSLTVGSTLSFVVAEENVQQSVTVTSILTAGSADQTSEAYRESIKAARIAPRVGGGLSDIRRITEAPGSVARTFPYRSAVAGFVDVFVQSATTANGIPTASELTEVTNAVSASSLTAVGNTNVLPITIRAFTVNVVGLSDATAQNDIRTAVEGFFESREPFIPALDSSRKDQISLTRVTSVVDDVVDSLGAIFTTLSIVSESVNITGVYTLDSGQKVSVTVTFS